MSDLERWCKRFSDSNISFAKQHQFPQIVHLLFDCQWSDHVMNIYQLLVPICVWAVKLLLLIESVERREDLNIAASVHPSTFCFVFRLFDVWIKYWRRPLEPIYHFMDIWFPSRATVNFNFTLACSLDVALEVSQVSFLVVFFVCFCTNSVSSFGVVFNPSNCHNPVKWTPAQCKTHLTFVTDLCSLSNWIIFTEYNRFPCFLQISISILGFLLTGNSP